MSQRAILRRQNGVKPLDHPGGFAYMIADNRNLNRL